jgi:cytochrome c556
VTSAAGRVEIFAAAEPMEVFLRLLPLLAVLVAGTALARPSRRDTPPPPPAPEAPAAPAPEVERPPIVEYRHVLMEAMGKHMGAASRIVRGQVERPQDLALHARALNELGAPLTELFPAGTGPDAVPTDSLPAVWERWDEFVAAAAAYQQATAAFVEATATEGADTGAAFREVGRTCGGCHDTFRHEEEEH